jgi:hypothetical protein
VRGLVAKITCPTCGFVFAVDTEGDEIVMKFNIAEWQVRCISQGGGGPALCLVMKQKILALLRETSGKLNGPPGQA